MADLQLGVVRGISYGLFGKPDEFVASARKLGAQVVRAYVYWGQIEPEPGRYTWDTLDALLDQLTPDVQVWLTLCSSSLWATQQPTDFLPPSPALDLAQYASFVREVVRHSGGRVRYWQCDNEPSNTGLLWAGSADEYVTQLAAMYRTVKELDPSATVVLGGCGYDVLTSSSGSPFFDRVLSTGGDLFDAFDVHLYGDPRLVPSFMDTVRDLLLGHELSKPILVGEYGGPIPFEFDEVGPVLASIFSSVEGLATQSTAELQARETQSTPERRAMTALYERMAELPPRLQMFLVGCPAALEAKRHRINCRYVVQTNLLALAAGVRLTLYWNLAPEVPAAVDVRQMMHLMFGKLPLLEYEGSALGVRRPAAETFELLTSQLAGTVSVRRLPIPVRAFEVERVDREPLVVLWDERDPFDGEDEPYVMVTLPWSAPDAIAVDAFGATYPLGVHSGQLRLSIADTPVFVTPVSQ
jgi:hypothetical protein